jgi:hypothetical protein
MMGTRTVGSDPGMAGLSLVQFLELARDPEGFARKLSEIQAAIEEMARQQSVLAAAQTEHAAIEAALVDRARALDSRYEGLHTRESKCVTSEAETGRRQLEQDTRARELAQLTATLERRELVTEQRAAALKAELRRVATAIDTLKSSVEEHP